ncbi:hypothetical protein [uncultured Fibrobacter sp.]|uniref:hypothetical protein n=1 Tax=uncultured Fibrobacter sp. TaxID=261512 RepID=UPI00259934C1|nr:hypothetical protein [uncultured Fibrobacter sp.]
MIDWKKQIPSCFGVMDLHFAVHPLDNDRARQLLIDVLNEPDVTYKDFTREVKDYLTKNTSNKNLVREQMKRVKNLKTYFENK